MQRKQHVGEKALQADTSAPAKYQYTFIDYLMLTAAICVCLWSWIFVEPDTLQRSAAAQTVVKVVTSVVPWVAALERYGPHAHKLLLVHSVCYLVFLPLVVWYLKLKIQPRTLQRNEIWPALGWGLGVVIFGLFISSIYFNLDNAFSGATGKKQFGLMVYAWSMPIAGSIITASILFSFISVLCLLSNVLKAARKLYA